jgi:HSP20 family protein
MGDLLQTFFSDPFLAGPMAPAVVPVWVPPFDIEETQDSYIMEMDLPGVRPEDVNIELIDGDTLRITGRYTGRQRTGHMRRQERQGGQAGQAGQGGDGGADFEYDIILPGEINADQIDASLEYGVLTVRAAKAQPQAHRIPVKAGGATGQGGGAAGRTPPVAGSMGEATTGGVSSAEAPGTQTRVQPGGGPGRTSR